MSDRLSDLKAKAEYEAIRLGLLSVTGFDIGNYKPGQMMRILTAVMGKAGARDANHYIRLLREDPKRIQDFRNCITINVSEFFRDKHLFDYLDRNIIQKLLRRTPRLRIWSAGCSGGEEPYSLAILLEEKLRTRFFDYEILATDIDEDALASARTGTYSEKALKNVAGNLREIYFDRVKENFQVRQKLKTKIQFMPHDLLKPFLAGRFHIILCRNVVIYFSEKAKEQVYRNITSALESGGVLLIGATENLLNYRDFGLEKIETYFYRRVASE